MLLHEGHRDELELFGAIGRVDDEDLPGGLVRVGGDVLAVDGMGVVGLWVLHALGREGLELVAAGLFVHGREREALEVLEEAGLDAAHEGLEARGGGLGAIVEDALLQGEGGADADPLEGLGA